MRDGDVKKVKRLKNNDTTWNLATCTSSTCCCRWLANEHVQGGHSD